MDHQGQSNPPPPEDERSLGGRRSTDRSSLLNSRYGRTIHYHQLSIRFMKIRATGAAQLVAKRQELAASATWATRIHGREVVLSA